MGTAFSSFRQLRVAEARMRRIFAISPENEFADEINVVPKLVESGLEAYHLRRPQESSRDVADFLGRMPSSKNEEPIASFAEELGKGN